MIPETLVAQIKESIDIVQLIGEFTSLKRKGVNYLGLCPFHNEKTPSFTVNPAKGSYKCFGCDKGGGAINFIMDHEKFTYPEALSFIANRNNIPFEVSGEEFKSNKNIYSLLSFAQQFFQQEYHVIDNPAVAYALSRGIENNQEFYQGYARGGKLLSSAALNAGYTQEQLTEAGLLGQSAKGYYDYFIDRLVFPYFDLMGRVIGFTGRNLLEDSQFPKYFNSPETPLFKKGKVLFGIHQAKNAIVHEDECILVEGQIDVISLHQSGIQNVVCSSGTALSADQVKLIRRFTSNVTILFDGDKAGQAATLKSIDIILGEGLNAWIIALPEGEDPDTFCKGKSPEDLKAFIEDNRKDWVDYRYNTGNIIEAEPTEKIALIKELASSCALIEDEISRAGFMKKVSQVFNFPYEALEKSILKKLPEIAQKEDYPGFFAFDNAKESILVQDEVVLYPNNRKVVEQHLEECTNTIGFPVNPLSKVQISELADCTNNVRIDIPLEGSLIQEKDNPVIAVALELVKNHFNVLVSPDPSLCFSTSMVSFVDYYIVALVHNLHADHLYHDDKAKKKAVEKTAELISQLDNTSITLKIPWAAKRFEMTTASFNKIIKPFIDRKRNVSSQNAEDIVIDEKRYFFDIENLPQYVDKKFFYRFGFFPAENESGKKIFYVFRTSENTLVKVGNFYLDPLFQVFDLDPNRNKRVVQLNHAELGRSEFVEMPSGGMMDFASFKKFLWNQGGYVFSKGKNYHHEIILESIALQFPKCYEFSTFGWQPEGFFAFANGIYAEGVFMPVDELGLVAYMKETYYSPAFSKIFAEQRQDSDKYINDRFLIH